MTIGADAVPDPERVPAAVARSGDAAREALAADVREGTVAVGLTVGFAALIMTFAALLMAYGTVRIQAGSWPPEGESLLLNAMWPWLVAATITSLAGSLAMRSATRRCNQIERAPLGPGAFAASDFWSLATETSASHPSSAAMFASVSSSMSASASTSTRRRFVAALLLTAAFGAAFLIAQVSGGRHLLALGVRPSAGIAASVVYALTAFHALHALVATVAVLSLAWQARRTVGGFVARSTVNATAAFVHLVAILWLVVGFAVFVI